MTVLSIVIPAYNEEHGIQPASIIKAVRDLTDSLTPQAVAEARGEYRAGKEKTGLPKGEIKRVIEELEKQMKESAKNLEFEKAAVLRDQIFTTDGMTRPMARGDPRALMQKDAARIRLINNSSAADLVSPVTACLVAV